MGGQLRQECHQCLRSRHKQRNMSTMPQAMSIVSEVVDVCHHTLVFLRGSCLKLESIMPTWDRKNPSDDFGVQMQTYRVPGSDAGAREGHECLCTGLLWLRGLGWKRLLLRSDNERALLVFLRAAAADLEGVEVIEQASPEGDHAANGLAEVGVREVKAQTRVLKSLLEERLKRQLDWSEPLATWWLSTLSKLLVEGQNSSRWRRQDVEIGEKAAFLPVAARREGRVAGDSERMMNGIFVGHHERTSASLFLSERGLLRGTRVHQKTADQQWDNEFIGKCRGVPWTLGRMLPLVFIGEEPEVRPPPVSAVVMLAPEAIVTTPQQRRRCTLTSAVCVDHFFDAQLEH